MGDLLKRGSQWLEQMRAMHCSSPVTYKRGNQEAVLSATFGRTEYEIQDEFGIIVAAHTIDFLIVAADFVSVFQEPEPGDRIVTDAAVYEVMSLGAQGHWRWSDSHRNTMRIHTKETGTV